MKRSSGTQLRGNKKRKRTLPRVLCVFIYTMGSTMGMSRESMQEPSPGSGADTFGSSHLLPHTVSSPGGTRAEQICRTAR